MKVLKKIVVFALCAITCFGALSCKGKKEEQNSAGNTGVNAVLPDSDDFLIKNGKSEYRIVTSESPKVYEKHAANELQSYIEKATQVELPIVAETQVSYGANEKLLVVGETGFSATANVSADKNTYGGRGFVVKKVDTNVFMLGGDDAGTLYAVYEFLHHQLGFEAYALDEISLQKGVQNNALKAYNLSEIPDIAYVNGMGLAYRDAHLLEGHTMRFNVFKEVFINASSQPWHNSFAFISPAEYYESHPKWFTGTDELRDQFHYTAHGDKEELQALQDLLFEKFVEAIERDFAQGKYYEYIGFMQQDSSGFFPKDDKIDGFEYNEANDSVLALKRKYGDKGANAAMLIQFINPIAKRLRTYMEENHNGRNMNVMIMGYEDSDKAPVKLVNGEYQPIDEDVKLESNVSVFLVPIRNNYIVDAEESGIEVTMSEWSAITDKLALWFHSYYFQNMFVYYDSTYSLQSYYQAAKAANTVYLFNEAPIDSSQNITSFGALKIYLNAKLGWDVDANVDELVDNFFINYYKDAATSIRTYFEELRTHVAMLKAAYSFKGICGAGISSYEDRKYWPEGVVYSFMQYIEQAYEDILPIKQTDSALYEKLYQRITTESLMPRYFSLRFYGQEMYASDAEFEAAVAQFKADCRAVGGSEYDYRGYTIDSLVFSR